MKTIENWEVVEIIDGKEHPGIPLPGCTIKGELDGKNVTIKMIEVNISRLIAIDENEEIYSLSGAKKQYLDVLNNAILENAKQSGEIQQER